MEKTNPDSLDEVIQSEDVQPTQERKSLWQKITDLYFKPKFFEKSGRIYELLGVRYFKKLVLKFGDLFGRGDNLCRISQSYLNSENGLRSLDRSTRIAELVHSPVTLLLGYQTVDDLANGNYVLATINGAFGLLNAYLSMTQRYNRTRIYDMLDRIEARKKNKK